jgi:rSAM/selenodomain-associated transferase 2
MSVVVSIIIPTYNEQNNLEKVKPFYICALQNNNIELIVVDGSSTDNTVAVANKFATRVVQSPIKSRAAQMNYGASIASGSILYFVHADVIPHNDFYQHINDSLKHNIDLGCYRYVFDSNSKMLRFNAYMTKYNGAWAGGGDQTLFVSKNNFNALNGFNQECIIMEDFDFVKRAKKSSYTFTILPYNVKVSARKYINNSWLRVQLVNALIVITWKMGASQQWLKSTYSKLLRP